MVSPELKYWCALATISCYNSATDAPRLLFALRARGTQERLALYASTGTRREGSLTMSEQNKALSKRFAEEVFNHGKLQLADELVASNATFHDPGGPGGKVTV